MTATTLQGALQGAQHAASDSVAASAIDVALSSGAIVNWKIAATVLVTAFMVGAFVVLLMELRTIKRSGGLKKWVRDVPTTEYRTVRLIWLSEAIVVVLTLAVIAHAVWPQVVGELQTEMVYAIFAFLGLGQGLSVTQFVGKRATEKPELVAAEAAATEPGVMPLVTRDSRTGVTTVSAVAHPSTAEHPAVTAPLQTVTHPIDPGVGQDAAVTTSHPATDPAEWAPRVTKKTTAKTTRKRAPLARDD